MDMTKRMKKSIEAHYHDKDMELMAKTVAISAVTAAVVSVFIICNADRITYALRGARSSVKENIKTSTDFIKDKISQVAETGEEKIEAVKIKVNNLKNGVVEGFKKADDIVEDVSESLTEKVQQGVEDVTDDIDSFVEEL